MKEENKQKFISNLKLQNLICITSQFEIKNNVPENIDRHIITTIIKFRFPNKNLYYIKSESKGSIDKNSSFSIGLNDILALSNGYNDYVFSVHIADKVTISHYVSADNSVGYSNNKDIDKIDISAFGVIVDKKTVKTNKYGQRIYKKDITQLFYE